MRLVIPYKLAEPSDELRFAIRSMVKHFKPLSGVLLVGDKPEWYCGDHIPMADIMYPDNPRIAKEKSMQLKILAVPDEAFLYSNDDFFANADFSITPYYYDVECWEMARDHSIYHYKEMYENCLANWKNFDVHTPMIMLKDKFETSFREMEEQTPIKTTYAHTFQGTQIYDVKIRGFHTLDELNYIIKDRPFFSTHNSAINDDLLILFNLLYPQPSKYERY